MGRASTLLHQLASLYLLHSLEDGVLSEAFIDVIDDRLLLLIDRPTALPLLPAELLVAEESPQRVQQR